MINAESESPPPGVRAIEQVYRAVTGEAWKDTYIASLEKENAILRAEMARFRKAIENIERAVIYATRFDDAVPLIDGKAEGL